jgi:hypothetical protein
MNWDDEWPAANVPVTYSVTGGAATLGCGQSTCTATTAQNGNAAMMVSATSSALTQVTASLSNGASIQTEFSGAAPPAIGAITPDLYLAIGATIAWSPRALVLLNGAPAAGQSVTWTTSAGELNVPPGATLSAANGIATQAVTAGPMSAGDAASLNACVIASANCAAFTVFAVHVETAQLSPWSGLGQIVTGGQNFAPVTVEVTDAVGHPMAGAAVTFYETLHAWTPACPPQGACPPAPVLAQAVVPVISGADGLTTLAPLPLNNQPGRLDVVAVTGQSATLEFELQSTP